jgi:hypothetical protein
MKLLKQTSRNVLITAGVAFALAVGFMWLHEIHAWDGVRVFAPQRAKL